MATEPIITFIRARARGLMPHDATIVNGLVDEILGYESRLDGEYCSHTPDDIANGQCRDSKPDQITGLRLIASRWKGAPGYDTAWTPQED